MQKNHRLILGFIIIIFVLIITVFFFTWEDSEIPDKWITGGLLIANLSVALLIYLQIRQKNNHFLDLNRPWISLRVENIRRKVGNIDKFSCSLYLENTGKLSAKNLVITNMMLRKNPEPTESKSPLKEKFNEREMCEIIPNYSSIIFENAWFQNDNIFYRFEIKYSYENTKYYSILYLYRSGKITMAIDDVGPETSTKIPVIKKIIKTPI